jgi:Family of unknown function (DUF5675)
MNLKVSRLTFTDKSTIGLLSVDGTALCSTLELPFKDGLPGSAIPDGQYPMTAYPSPKFGRIMPLILGIPGRSQIEMHWGNYPTDTDGCILVGAQAGPDMIEESRETFDKLWALIQGPLEAGQVTITVTGAPPPAQAINVDASDA